MVPVPERQSETRDRDPPKQTVEVNVVFSPDALCKLPSLIDKCSAFRSNDHREIPPYDENSRFDRNHAGFPTVRIPLRPPRKLSEFPGIGEDGAFVERFSCVINHDPQRFLGPEGIGQVFPASIQQGRSQNEKHKWNHVPVLHSFTM